MSRIPGGPMLPGGLVTCDCVIRTHDGGAFLAHKAFMCTASPFFRALFRETYGSPSDVVLGGVTASVLETLLGFYYTDELALSSDKILPVLTAADMLLMDEARDRCLAHMLRDLRPDNCLGMATIAQDHWPRFRGSVLRFVREHFDEVWRDSAEFPQSPGTLLAELLGSDELNIRREADLLLALQRWAQPARSRDDPKHEDGELEALLQHVRVGLCGKA